MPQTRLVNSVVTRLVAALVIGGGVMLMALGLLDLNRSKATLRVGLSRDVAITMRNVQGLMDGAIGRADPAEVERMLGVVTSDRRIRAVRLEAPALGRVQVGDWPEGVASGTPNAAVGVWLLPEAAVPVGTEIGLDRPTLVQAPFTLAGQPAMLEVMVDGKRALHDLRAQIYDQMMARGLLLAVMTLLGLLLVRRWVAGPLADTMELVQASAGAERFQELAHDQHGEFGRLAEAVGGMLARLDSTAEQLRQRERALEDLYQSAPAAMISLDATGRIVEANRRAAQLLHVSGTSELVGTAVMDLVKAEDRALLRQTIDRLDLDVVARCQMRILAGPGPSGPGATDVIAECAGMRAENGAPRGVRLSLLDISQATRLQRDIAEQTRLLNLVFDHMSDGILLVGNGGKIAAVNQTLATLLHERPDQLVGHDYDPEHFWDSLGVASPDVFVSRLRQIDADRELPAQERFEARAGTFQFRGIPMHDATGRVAGRLWVVQEITPQERAQRLINQQTQQLQALRRLGQELGDVGSVDELLQRAAAYLFEVFGVDAVGVAVRSNREGSRSRQLLHRGPGAYLLATNRPLVEAIEKHLMRATLTSHEVMFWSELPSTLPWARVFNQAGLTCVASAPLRGSADSQGIVWIARRGGERLERHHIHMLEAMAPIIAGRMEFAQLREAMRHLEMTDPVTDAANQHQFDGVLARLQNRPGYPWAVVLLKLDRFHRFNDRADHAYADRILRSVAASIHASIRKSCIAARLEGALFAVLCPDTPRAQALAVAERLRKVVSAKPLLLPNGQQDTVTASIGVTCSPEDGFAGADLVHLARARVEAAKRAGRDRVVAEGITTEKHVG